MVSEVEDRCLCSLLTFPVQITVESFDGSWHITEVVMGDRATNIEKAEIVTRTHVESLDSGEI